MEHQLHGGTTTGIAPLPNGLLDDLLALLPIVLVTIVMIFASKLLQMFSLPEVPTLHFFGQAKSVSSNSDGASRFRGSTTSLGSASISFQSCSPLKRDGGSRKGASSERNGGRKKSISTPDLETISSDSNSTTNNKKPVDQSSADPVNPMAKIVEMCSILHEKYVPPLIGGRTGHFQTVTYSLFGRVTNLALSNIRYFFTLTDGTTITFDVFEPLKKHPSGDITLAICPGIANSSESAYIRTLINYTQKSGFRCAVLNHLGAIRSVRLTSDRIFTYGGTEEYKMMILKLGEMYPETRFLIAGFSMGGNIVTKYLGEDPVLADRIIAGISVCQGYDASKASGVMMEWENFRRMYLYLMTENIKHLLRDHYDEAVAPHVKSGLLEDEQELWSATSLMQLDDCYSRKVAGFDSLAEYYSWCSCSRVMRNIKVPMLYLNALDDPLIPESLLGPPKEIAETTPNVLFVTTKHGGHLGFLEGILAGPYEVTWLDRFLVQFANAAIQVYGGGLEDPLKPSVDLREESLPPPDPAPSSSDQAIGDVASSLSMGWDDLNWNAPIDPEGEWKKGKVERKISARGGLGELFPPETLGNLDLGVGGIDMTDEAGYFTPNSEDERIFASSM